LSIEIYGPNLVANYLQESRLCHFNGTNHSNGIRQILLDSHSQCAIIFCKICYYFCIL